MLTLPTGSIWEAYGRQVIAMQLEHSAGPNGLPKRCAACGRNVAQDEERVMVAEGVYRCGQCPVRRAPRRQQKAERSSALGKAISPAGGAAILAVAALVVVWLLLR